MLSATTTVPPAAVKRKLPSSPHQPPAKRSVSGSGIPSTLKGPAKAATAPGARKVSGPAGTTTENRPETRASSRAGNRSAAASTRPAAAARPAATRAAPGRATASTAATRAAPARTKASSTAPSTVAARSRPGIGAPSVVRRPAAAGPSRMSTRSSTGGSDSRSSQAVSALALFC